TTPPASPPPRSPRNPPQRQLNWPDDWITSPGLSLSNVSLTVWPSTAVTRRVKLPSPKPPPSVSVPSELRVSANQSAALLLLTSALATGSLASRPHKLVHQMLAPVWNW